MVRWGAKRVRPDARLSITGYTSEWIVDPAPYSVPSLPTMIASDTFTTGRDASASSWRKSSTASSSALAAWSVDASGVPDMCSSTKSGAPAVSFRSASVSIRTNETGPLLPSGRPAKHVFATASSGSAAGVSSDDADPRDAPVIAEGPAASRAESISLVGPGPKKAVR
eukprot:4877724-Prymnesium_polylepis.1